MLDDIDSPLPVENPVPRDAAPREGGGGDVGHAFDIRTTSARAAQAAVDAAAAGEEEDVEEEVEEEVAEEMEAAEVAAGAPAEAAEAAAGSPGAAVNDSDADAPDEF